MLLVEIVEFGRFGRCVRIPCGQAEALVTLDIGPRVMAFRMKGGRNLLCELGEDDALGPLGMRLYGGHRIWAGPENPNETYQPDNEPVEYRQDGDRHVFVGAPDGVGIRRTLALVPDSARDGVRLEHTIRNDSARPRAAFPWVLTMMAPGGACLFPLPKHASHTEALQPAAPLVLWRYTRLDDPRWSFGPGIAMLRQDSRGGPQKVGAFVEQGWAGYLLGQTLFLKRFPADAPFYPDLGCNFETFTNEAMLEVESLGPLAQLEPGHETSHQESWYLVDGVEEPTNAIAALAWMSNIVASRPL